MKKELHGLGARRIGVYCTPPLGCLPSQISIGGGKQRECVDNINEESKLFNAKLSSELDSLNTNFPLARFVYIDIYNPLLDLIQNPLESGIILPLVLFFSFHSWVWHGKKFDFLINCFRI